MDASWTSMDYSIARVLIGVLCGFVSSHVLPGMQCCRKTLASSQVFARGALKACLTLRFAAHGSLQVHGCFQVQDQQLPSGEEDIMLYLHMRYQPSRMGTECCTATRASITLNPEFRPRPHEACLLSEHCHTALAVLDDENLTQIEVPPWDVGPNPCTSLQKIDQQRFWPLRKCCGHRTSA